MAGNLAQQISSVVPQNGPLTPAGNTGVIAQAVEAAAPTQVSTAVNPAAPQPIGGK